MSGSFDTYPSLDSALSARFRGHHDRDWQEWKEWHHYEAAAEIPEDTERAWIGRQKLNYRGIADKKALRHLIAANVDQSFLEEVGKLSELRRLELEWPFLGSEVTPLLSLKRLEHLSIDSPRKLSDFSALLDLPSLRTLLITNAKKMTNLEWLSDAHHLEVIGIEGAMDSPYKIERPSTSRRPQIFGGFPGRLGPACRQAAHAAGRMFEPGISQHCTVCSPFRVRTIAPYQTRYRVPLVQS